MDLTGKKVYISGPITGINNLNYEAFFNAMKYVLDQGASSAYNPLIKALHGEDAEVYEHSYYMLKDLHALTEIKDEKPNFDAIAMLPGWEKSQGARVEFMVAVACGIEVIYL